MLRSHWKLENQISIMQNLIQLNQSFKSMKKCTGKKQYVRKVAVRNYPKYGRVLLLEGLEFGWVWLGSSKGGAVLFIVRH